MKKLKRLSRTLEGVCRPEDDLRSEFVYTELYFDQTHFCHDGWSLLSGTGLPPPPSHIYNPEDQSLADIGQCRLCPLFQVTRGLDQKVFGRLGISGWPERKRKVFSLPAQALFYY